MLLCSIVRFWDKFDFSHKFDAIKMGHVVMVDWVCRSLGAGV